MLTGTAAAGSRRSPRHVAGLLLVAAGAVYLIAEGAAAVAFSPRYSYATNYISDLGVAACGAVFEGRPICSPLHLVIDTGLILAALCFLAAAVICAWTISGWWRTVFVALVATHAVGNSLVALFPETAASTPDAPQWHLLGATLAIIGGNVAILSAAPLARALGLPPLNRFACVVFPVLGLVALRMLMVTRSHVDPGMLSDGTLERISVYTITGWQLLTGVCLLRSPPPPTLSRASAGAGA